MNTRKAIERCLPKKKELPTGFRLFKIEDACLDIYNSALSTSLDALCERSVKTYAIAHILSGQEGVGAYTPEQLKQAEALQKEYIILKKGTRHDDKST